MCTEYLTDESKPIQTLQKFHKCSVNQNLFYRTFNGLIQLKSNINLSFISHYPL